ncbi:hypothetical protein [Ralstonia mannitolilytica]|uniref:Uncharacterized protein n=1 Tax=Ralstonia mannitolilytica TaxID=105219 RepID=A0AAD2B3B3_9RALS|nr:hypothetical protein [Ralstonia mannitolilytica]ATG21272.1 hypothetical protein CO705_01530 [Ralstonia pickettii]ANA34886.1 hypothetical protein VZ52_07260 [Ralstonia mannitolilytica]MBY4720842.1 hypothetical protein [Ralstonia mannitolilytica]CAJ0696357.1 hypothetical protein R82526_04477 [Ralstonia mannitolilytica]CAJ0698137.1 hypothetical protein R77591_04926 [Ralstonia mannitolilytica]
MRLKQIGLAALLAAGAMAAGGAWAQASRVEVFGQAALAQRFDVYSDGARTGRFDTYTEGARSGRFDPYSEGMRSDPAGRSREGGGTVYGYPVPN